MAFPLKNGNEDNQRLLDEIHNVTEVYTNKHFVYTSGAHGDGYVNYRALKEPANRNLLKRASLALLVKIAGTTDLDTNKPIVVVGPETLGALMVSDLSDHFSRLALDIHALALLKTEVDKQFIWDEDPSKVIKSGAQIIWFDDLLNKTSTFSATKLMIEALEAQIHTIAVIGDRSKKTAEDLDVGNIVSLEDFDLSAFDPEDCPLCANSVPIVQNLGHGAKYKLAHPNYPGGYIDL